MRKTTATPALRKTVFECPKCRAVRTIECLGRVVLAPVCSRCGLRMKPMGGGGGGDAA
ncbi:hypothetical protein Btus_1943 [Kyrpidia tusciae DSM 2912]|uniref:Uncharacterized protein n=1 Tax=Kyrpidia tusciae (strain DSM 2912 / NBRC 15312 / T2) TaxID=562970 RepID=D5WQM9_KYRT2|nr:hypothetical protein Btus_1943 [Kyrpidia tusciae DSM 2912]